MDTNLDIKLSTLEKMNDLYKEKKPFFFIVDFLSQKPMVIELKDLLDEHIYYYSPSGNNIENVSECSYPLIWEKFPISFDIYEQQFKKVQEQIQTGNSYLINLTFSTEVRTNYSLEQLFSRGEAKYKLLFKDQFVHFSPEPFIQIKGDKIYSYPMKGTISCEKPNAEQQLLFSEKETAEQYTIVDLIRNDLSIVARDVEVEDFRYMEKISTNQKDLFAVSSKISGTIKDPYILNPGTLLSKILPAGSITGAPKEKTIEIIRKNELHNRNYYTGVWGIFNGESLDSCVIIRYLEKTTNGFEFKSGGGITSLSEPLAEYQEMIDKIYVPIF